MAFQQPALLNGHPEQQQISFASEHGPLPSQPFPGKPYKDEVESSARLPCRFDSEPISETLSLSIAQHLSASLSISQLSGLFS